MSVIPEGSDDISPLVAFSDIDAEISEAKRAPIVDHFHLLSLLEQSLRMKRAALPDSHPVVSHVCSRIPLQLRQVLAAMKDLCLECNAAVQTWMRAPQPPVAPPDSPHTSFVDVLQRAEYLSEALGTTPELSLTINPTWHQIQYLRAVLPSMWEVESSTEGSSHIVYRIALDQAAESDTHNASLPSGSQFREGVVLLATAYQHMAVEYE
ncbi:hypothetical protein FOL47_008676 [Perkinsus chesapeaki]|uniref:Uncharacterized protein n=1 Tax=Perkinsus chesapeaki TaxID=330153 RepID=A0A7J6MT67_PERCH|nr:hypothetical protein FOL47_008676 [Perkinsus chesapeaki]